MLEWLLKYPLNIWRDAEIVFVSGWPLALLVLAIVLSLLVLAVLLAKRSISLVRKLTLFALQATVSAVLLVMLWQPALQVQVSAAGENTVAWVLDSSASMQALDATTDNLQSRLSAGAALIENLVTETDSTFNASLYRLGDDLVNVDSAAELVPQQSTSRTQIASGLDALLSAVNESALAAVVLLSDGSDNSGLIDSQWWQRLSAAGVPVHTVGMGQAVNDDDLQLSDVTLPSSAPPNSRVTARLRVSHGSVMAEAGRARIRVFSGQDLITALDIVLPAGVDQSVHRVSFPIGDRGIRQLVFDIQRDGADAITVPPEANLANNRQPRVLRVDDTPKRILYVEGEPRWEYKFLRRALDNHTGIELVSLLRTSPNKFYRQGVKDADELASGFPSDRDSLFVYDAVIIGSFEAVELTTEQQIALRDFVSVRGGSLLMLGGRHALADGGWGRSVVAPALPVALSSKLNAKTFDRVRMQVEPTLSGYRSSWLQLDDSPADNVNSWRELPMIADSQELGAVKPGAVVLLTRRSSEAAAAEPLLVQQRYGRGQSVVLGTSGTWRWQMGLPSEDQRHERFWQQLAGMLVEPVVPRLLVETSNAVYRDNDTASVSITAFNGDFTPLMQAQLPVRMTLPDGSVKMLSLEADAKQPGLYSGVLPTELDGPYSLSAISSSGGESSPSPVSSQEQWWVRESGTAESFNSSQQVDFLKRIADATGGQYHDFNDSKQLLAALTENNAALKRDEKLPFWNMPLFFLIILIAKLTEWVLRMWWKRL